MSAPISSAYDGRNIDARLHIQNGDRSLHMALRSAETLLAKRVEIDPATVRRSRGDHRHER